MKNDQAAEHIIRTAMTFDVPIFAEHKHGTVIKVDAVTADLITGQRFIEGEVHKGELDDLTNVTRYSWPFDDIVEIRVKVR